jgi:DNA-binding transcriptional regulator of glucitol operon
MQPIDVSATMIILGLATAWFMQLLLSYFQLRRFYGRVNQLRKSGNFVSIGVSGSAWKGRQYAILVVDPQTDVIRQSEQLSGWTVLANLKPLHGLEGMTLQELLDEEKTLPHHINRKLVLALRDAAKHIVEYKNRKKEANEKQLIDLPNPVNTLSVSSEERR